jgi:hypothetical protein
MRRLILETKTTIIPPTPVYTDEMYSGTLSPKGPWFVLENHLFKYENGHLVYLKECNIDNLVYDAISQYCYSIRAENIYRIEDKTLTSLAETQLNWSLGANYALNSCMYNQTFIGSYSHWGNVCDFRLYSLDGNILSTGDGEVSCVTFNACFYNGCVFTTAYYNARGYDAVRLSDYKYYTVQMGKNNDAGYLVSASPFTCYAYFQNYLLYSESHVDNSNRSKKISFITTVTQPELVVTYQIRDYPELPATIQHFGHFNAQVIFVYLTNGQIWKSTDGLTFTNSGLTPVGGGNLICAKDCTYFFVNGQRIYYYTLDGITWTTVNY